MSDDSKIVRLVARGANTEDKMICGFKAMQAAVFQIINDYEMPVAFALGCVDMIHANLLETTRGEEPEDFDGA